MLHNPAFSIALPFNPACNLFNSHSLVNQVKKRFLRVSELSKQVHSQGRLFGVRPEPALGVCKIAFCQEVHKFCEKHVPKPLNAGGLFLKGLVLEAAAGCNVSLPVQNRRNKLWNVLWIELAVRVNVYNKVGAHCQRFPDSIPECNSQASIFWMGDNPVCTGLLCPLNCLVGTSVVQHKHFNLSNPKNFLGDILNHTGNGLFLVKCRN